MIADVDRLIVGEDAGLEGARPPAPTMQTNGRTGTYPSLVNINSDKGISVNGGIFYKGKLAIVYVFLL